MAEHIRERRAQNQYAMMLIAKGLLHGLALGEIYEQVNATLQAEERGYSLNIKQIQKLCSDVRREWQKQRIFNVNEAMNMQLDRLLELENEAREAWERSKLVKTVLKHTNKSKGAPVLDAAKRVQFNKAGTIVRVDGDETVSRTETGQVGDPRFLELMLRCWRERNALFGFNTANEPQDMRELIQQQYERAQALRAQIESIKAQRSMSLTKDKAGTYSRAPEEAGSH